MGAFPELAIYGDMSLHASLAFMFMSLNHEIGVRRSRGCPQYDFLELFAGKAHLTRHGAPTGCVATTT